MATTTPAQLLMHEPRQQSDKELLASAFPLLLQYKLINNKQNTGSAPASLMGVSTCLHHVTGVTGPKTMDILWNCGIEISAVVNIQSTPPGLMSCGGRRSR